MSSRMSCLVPGDGTQLGYGKTGLAGAAVLMFMPDAVRSTALKWAHSCHPGSRRTLAFVRQSFRWPTLVQHVFRIHGLPVDMVSDREPQFSSQFWNAFCTLIGSSVSLSTPSPMASWSEPTRI